MNKSLISASVIDQTLHLVNCPRIASGGVDEVKIYFDFCSLWDGCGKIAVFYRDPEDVYHKPIVDGLVTVPHEVLAEAGFFYFGVMGSSSNIRTTEVLRVKVVQGAITEATNVAEEPTPDIYQQLLGAYGAMEASLAVERARITNLAKMKEGSTTGDAELLDMRIGADGVTYQSAGEATRSQIKAINGILDRIYDNDEGNIVDISDENMAMALGTRRELITFSNGGFISTQSKVAEERENRQFGFSMNTVLKREYRLRFILTKGTLSFVSVNPGTPYGTNTSLVRFDIIGPGEYEGTFVATSEVTTLHFYQRYNIPEVAVSYIICSEDSEGIKQNVMGYKGNDVSVFSKVLCIGDSLTQGTFDYTKADGSNAATVISKYSYPAIFTKITGVETTNHGHGGYTAKMFWDNYGTADLSGHDACIIMLGINDGANYVDVSEFSTAMVNIVNKVRTDNPGIIVFISTLLPAYVDPGQKYVPYNEEIVRLVEEELTGVFLLDITKYSDCKYNSAYHQGHLTAIGYARLAHEFATLISYTIKNNLAAFKDVQFIGTSYEYTPES